MRDRLVEIGHTVNVPRDAEAYAQNPAQLESKWQKNERDLIRRYYKEIGECDAILVLNMTKQSVSNYIGGNTFLEMGFAHVLNKTIYLFFPIPDMPYREEMMAMQPVVLNGDISLMYAKK